MFFEIVGRISAIETIASGKGIRENRRLRKLYGGGKWKKLKGTAMVKLADGTMCQLSCIGTKPTASPQKSLRLNAF
jgi:hypothetical protein